jgi:hypothetical protein
LQHGKLDNYSSTVFNTGRLILTVSENDMLCFSMVRRIAFFPVAVPVAVVSRQAYSHREREEESKVYLRKISPLISPCFFESDLS